MFLTHHLRFELGTLANRTLPGVVADGFAMAFSGKFAGGNGLVRKKFQ
jgi:hypothetical protein